jgi:hypothetical protein
VDAVTVAVPVASELPLEPAEARVLGATATTCYVDLDGFVIAVTARGITAMPNGVVLHEDRLGAIPEGGVRARVSSARIVAGGVAVELGTASLSDPRVPANERFRDSDVSARGAEILGAWGVAAVEDPSELAEAIASTGELAILGEPGARAGLETLLRALSTRDPVLAGDAAASLLGLGGGLTPEGDDVVGGVAAAVRAFADACAFFLGPWLGALAPVDLRTRTNSLSATLVHLAAAGWVVDPLRGVLDLSLPASRWRPELGRLAALGHSTGPAWAIGSGAAAVMLASGSE